jgi:hypothetical protein
MLREPKLVQFGEYPLWHRHQLKQSLNRKTKGYESGGDFEGSVDNYGHDRSQLQSYEMKIENPIIDYESGDYLKNEEDARDSELLLRNLIGSGTSVMFFSALTHNYNWAYPMPMFYYNYGKISSQDLEYQTVFKKHAFNLKFDTPVFYEMPVNSFIFVPFDNAPAQSKRWTSGKKWTQGWKYSTLIPAYNLYGFPQILNKILFGDVANNSVGYLVFFDEYFFRDGKYIAPNFLANGMTTFLPSTSFYPSPDGFETQVTLGSPLSFDGSLDNHCYIIKIEKEVNYGDWIEIINTLNGTGIRIQIYKTSTIKNLVYYNMQNHTVYDDMGVKLNSDTVDVTVTIPRSAKDWLYIDSTLRSTSNKIPLYPPILKIISNNNNSMTFRMKNQRMYI